MTTESAFGPILGVLVVVAFCVLWLGVPALLRAIRATRKDRLAEVIDGKFEQSKHVTVLPSADGDVEPIVYSGRRWGA